jgi:arginyl-tRNA synthetase
LTYTSRQVLEVTPPKLVARLISRAASRLGSNINEQEVEVAVNPVPSDAPGDYGVALARFAKKAKVKPQQLLEVVADEAKKVPYIASLHFVRGYLNVEYRASEVAKLVFETARREGSSYGLVKTEKPLRIVVEHTSANPVHPLHIGHGRNSSIGDSLARILRARGHVVQTRFYINDVGRQVAVLAYGVLRAGLRPPPGRKLDHWIGLVYAITHTLVDLRRVREELEKLKKEGRYEEYRERVRELDDLVAALSRLREKDPELFDRIAKAVNDDSDPERSISDIMRGYEYRLDEDLVKKVREIVSYCLKGFQETLARLGVSFDVWDWESDLTWSSMVAKIVDEAKRNPAFTIHKGAYALSFNAVLADEEVAKKLGIPKGMEVPPLILVRSDGTTLYTTRDIAYTLKKFREFNADIVVNVIAAEQKLEQLQVRLALVQLGYRREGLNTIHYAYEMVNLPGTSMSGRRGQYVSLDELIDRAKAIAVEEVRKRNPNLSEEEVERIAEAVAVSAIRYSLISVSPSKPITFSIDEALNFERNSAPYLQYTHARASSILAKYGKPIEWDDIDYSAAEDDPLRRQLVLHLLEFPYIFVKAADEMKPEIIVTYLNKLADTFNTWYQRDPVLREQDPKRRNFKLALVYTVKTVLANALNLIGVIPLERM